MKITLVAAIATNGVIGRDGGMPWRLATDLRRFKATTIGKPVIMGRKTWESIPAPPLPGRVNIVISRDPAHIADGAVVSGSLDDAIAHAKALGVDEAYVIGGAEIFRQAMHLATALDITHVLADIKGDAYFPVIDPDEWAASAGEEIPAGDKDSHATRHVIYQRKIS